MYCSKTAFVTLTDKTYYSRALKTIDDLRGRGNWLGDVVLVCVDFEPPAELATMDILAHKVSHISHQHLFDTWKTFPIRPMADNRHYGKVYQWDKLQVFSDFFKQWERIVFLDAGLRVVDSVESLLSLPWRGKFLAPDDSDPYDNGNRFKVQLDLVANPKATEDFLSCFGEEILNQHYFLNCIFLFDTSLAGDACVKEMVDWMYRFPIMACNEMGIMNLFYMGKLNVWEAFPQKTNSGKYLFGWSEFNYRERPTWERFCFLKYPATVPF